MEEVLYPLGHTPSEIDRLQFQAGLFYDPLLATLAERATHCLEIGAGVGSNLPSVRAANAHLDFTGIDISPAAINQAHQMHGNETTRFAVMNASALDFPENSFDLVISKLVLWSVGAHLQTVIQEVLRVLKPGGVFYTFEPYNKALTFAPARPHLERLISQWDASAVKTGSDPFIGPKIPSALTSAGFNRVQTQFFPVLATSHQPEKYRAICNNLKAFYFGDAKTNPHSDMRAEKVNRAMDELFEDGLVMDSFFVSWGSKASSSKRSS